MFISNADGDGLFDTYYGSHRPLMASVIAIFKYSNEYRYLFYVMVDRLSIYVIFDINVYRYVMGDMKLEI